MYINLTMNKPKVSVLMATYKENVSAVKKAIDSIETQTISDWELVVVADDPSNEPVISYLREKEKRNKRVRLIIHKENRGLGGALNTAVSHAKGEYLARADVDDVSYPERLQEQLEYFDSHPETDLLFTGWRERRRDGEQRLRLPSSEMVREIKKYFFLNSLLLHPTLMTKAVVLQNNPYPEMSRPEDLVLFLTLMEEGYQFRLLPKVLYDYEVDTTLKYQKVRTYSANLLSVLLRKLPHWYSNPYYYLYIIRIGTEWLLSRNKYIYEKMNMLAAKIWRGVFGS